MWIKGPALQLTVSISTERQRSYGLWPIVLTSGAMWSVWISRTKWVAPSSGMRIRFHKYLPVGLSILHNPDDDVQDMALMFGFMKMYREVMVASNRILRSVFIICFNFNKKITGQRPFYNCRSGGILKYCSARLFLFISPISRNPIFHLKSSIYLSLEFWSSSASCDSTYPL